MYTISIGVNRLPLIHLYISKINEVGITSQLQEHNCIMYIELLIEVLQLYIYSVQASTLHKSVRANLDVNGLELLAVL